MKAPLPQGLYDLLTTQDFTDAAKALTQAGLTIHAEELNPEFSHERLADALAEQLSQLLAGITALEPASSACNNGTQYAKADT